MAEAPAHEGLQRLTLRSKLAELSRVAPWVEAMVAHCAIPEKNIFAINLCLEEALSNIVRHGYKGQTDRPITVAFHYNANELIFAIEDEAPHFRPVNVAIPAPHSLDEMTPGGLGIPLIHRFADRVEWEPLANGNRLTLRFARRS